MSKCRACFEEDRDYVEIFSVYGDVDISYLIRFCTGVEISNEDPFSQVICKECLDQLIIAEQIKKRFLQAEHELKNTLKLDSDIKQENDIDLVQHFESFNTNLCEFDQMIDFGVKSESEESEELEDKQEIVRKKKIRNTLKLDGSEINSKKCFRCQICKEIVNRTELRQHNLEKHKNILTCEICQISLSSKDTFRKHLRRHQTFDKPLHVCQGCGEKFYLTRHFIIHKCPVKPICHLCKLTFSCRKEILSHIEAKHLEDDCYRCHELNCTFTSRRAETYFYHLAGHFDPVNRLCEICSESFSDLRTYHAHKLKHKKITTRFFCDLCGHKVRRKANLIRHFRTSHIKTRFQCDECDRIYTDPAVLKQHKVSKHSLEAPFGCDQCNVRFIYQSMLKSHMKLHMKGYSFKPKRSAEERKNMTFACTLCQKTFQNEPNLRRHRDTVHLKIKRYACQTCEKAFSQKSALETHIRIHTGEKPFQCGYCINRYSDRSTLHKHLKNIHKDLKPIIRTIDSGAGT